MKNLKEKLKQQQQKQLTQLIQEAHEDEEEDSAEDEMDSEEEKKQKEKTLKDFLGGGAKQAANEPQIIDIRAKVEVQGPPQRRKSLLEDKSLQREMDYRRVNVHALNPKSITTKLLFGDFDEAGEWFDGITPKLFRDCNEDKSGNLNWILFDGPVDALWIENMNTVLDDNKKLCMVNGETIKLVEGMSILFEVEDLLEASPATVSRCGMVFLEGKDLGWEVLFEPWFAQITYHIQTRAHKKFFWSLIDWILRPLFRQVFLTDQEEKQLTDAQKLRLAPVRVSE